MISFFSLIPGNWALPSPLCSTWYSVWSQRITRPYSVMPLKFELVALIFPLLATSFTLFGPWIIGRNKISESNCYCSQWLLSLLVNFWLDMPDYGISHEPFQFLLELCCIGYGFLRILLIVRIWYTLVFLVEMSAISL